MLLQIEIPEDTPSALDHAPQELAREIVVAAAVKWYEARRLSQGKAAEVAGLSRAEFIDALSRYQVSPLQLTDEELDGEFRG